MECVLARFPHSLARDSALLPDVQSQISTARPPKTRGPLDLVAPSRKRIRAGVNSARYFEGIRTISTNPSYTVYYSKYQGTLVFGYQSLLCYINGSSDMTRASWMEACMTCQALHLGLFCACVKTDHAPMMPHDLISSLKPPQYPLNAIMSPVIRVSPKQYDSTSSSSDS